jgi:hypothetical protein
MVTGKDSKSTAIMLSTTIKEIMSLHFLSQLLASPPVFLEHSLFSAVVDFLCNYSLIFCITVIKKSCLFKSFFQNTNNASNCVNPSKKACHVGRRTKKTFLVVKDNNQSSVHKSVSSHVSSTITRRCSVNLFVTHSKSHSINNRERNDCSAAGL